MVKRIKGVIMSTQEFIENLAKYVKKYAPQYGIKVYSPIIAQGILESARGTSELAVNAHNYFGLKYRENRCPTAIGTYVKVGSEQNQDGTYTSSSMTWCKFADMENGVIGYFDFTNIPNYANLKGVTDPKTYLENIKVDGYATSLKYVDNLTRVIENYGLTKYDEEVDDMTKRVLVVIDPGHYPNYNKGAVAGYFEGDKMYDYSEHERDALKAYGIDVILTRGRANDLPLYQRGQVAVNHGKGYDVVIFKSNHSNGFNGQACGVTVIRSLYLPESEELGQKLIDAIVGVMKPVTGITYSRGVVTKQGNNGDYYGVIRGSVSGAKSEAEAKRGPVDYSFIVEHGFHDNVKECRFLNDASNLKKMAEAEAKVIADYFGLTKSHKPTPKEETTSELYRVRKSWNDSKSQIGAYKSLEGAKSEADKKTGYKVYNSVGECVYDPGKSDTSFKVKVVVDSLTYRSGAGTKYAIKGTVSKGEVFTIVETSGTWGKLKSGAGWINCSSKYVERL